MDRLEREKRYISLYRQQLKRELDAMGYGQKVSFVQDRKAQSSARANKSFAKSVVSLATARLSGATG